MFKRLLIANRGEIARRIARTCRRMGIEYVVVYSEADRDAPHLEGAAARVAIGPAAAARSYLDSDALIRAALSTGCEAVHPGYGFLSENAGFAAAVEAAGLVFVGPAPGTIADMGDKATAKTIMARAGVPVVPGSTEASDDPERIATLLAEVGYPALLKPVAGGGGKGMTIVESGDGRAAIESAIRTGRATFGDGRLLVECFVRNPRHVEVQVFGDGRGKVVHIFERECSLQRRHQKIVEEAPAATLPRSLRDALIEAAVRGASAISYRNAGTFEFIVGDDGSFYFLEVNTRLQVEHPVTEAITGLDLVEWQLRVAAGEPLPLSQDEIRSIGHAIECRVYAEDPAVGFRPAPGRVGKVRWPGDARVESAVEDGTAVPSDYDPMIAKLIVHAQDRPAAVEAMQAAIEGTAVVGLTTNLGFLQRLMTAPEVVAGEATTGFIDAVLPRLLPEAPERDMFAAAAAAVAFSAMPEERTSRSPWHAARPHDRALLDADAPLGRIALTSGDTRHVARLHAIDGRSTVLSVDGWAETRTVAVSREDGLIGGTVGGRRWHALVDPEAVDVTIAGTRLRFERRPAAADASADAAGSGRLRGGFARAGSGGGRGDEIREPGRRAAGRHRRGIGLRRGRPGESGAGSGAAGRRGGRCRRYPGRRRQIERQAFWHSTTTPLPSSSTPSGASSTTGLSRPKRASRPTMLFRPISPRRCAISGCSACRFRPNMAGSASAWPRR
jgi:acetyl/propionyl-CoA carboxylase alpha subunit